jgi:hypothetical protein
VADAGERSILRARKRRGDRLAAGLRRDDIFAAAGDQHFLVEPSRVLAEASLRQALQRLAVALRPDAALAPAHKLERERWRAFSDQPGRALLGQAFGPELVELLEPALQLLLFVRQAAISAGGPEQHHASHALRVRGGISAGHQAAKRVADQHHILQQQAVEKLVQRLRVIRRARRRAGQKIGFTVSRRIPRDQPIAGEAFELAEPARRARADAVHQHERLAGTGLAVGDGLRPAAREPGDAFIERH